MKEKIKVFANSILIKHFQEIPQRLIFATLDPKRKLKLEEKDSIFTKVNAVEGQPIGSTNMSWPILDFINQKFLKVNPVKRWM